MSAQAQSKSAEIHEALWAYINSGSVISHEDIVTFQHDISLFRGVEKAYLTALLYAAQADYAQAIHYFQEALQSDDSTVAINYLAYVGTSAHNYFHRMEIFRLEKQYCLPTIRRIARNAAYCIGNTRLIKSYTLKLAALCDDEERQALRDEGKAMIKAVEDFKQATTLTSNQIEELCDEAESIANQRGVNCIGVIYFVNGDSDNAYILRAETHDPELLAEMNIELLGLLSSDKYRHLPFTSWFTSDISRMERDNDR
ncbi:hypothetical protein C2U55_24935 [Enterobacteriaceae bacterium ENNIH3]|jgi:tetratricopeptide (TPR) repeat protein|nr:hypothetical protein C2U55_24935 [Enterobacteriaceae bacterium ENNIH3]AUV07863.1 hypothetical protein C2U52_17170 [Enterobacteriaceae bacterium ENNIH2]